MITDRHYPRIVILAGCRYCGAEAGDLCSMPGVDAWGLANRRRRPHRVRELAAQEADARRRLGGSD